MTFPSSRKSFAVDGKHGTVPPPLDALVVVAMVVVGGSVVGGG